jgi:hypothetical protein
MNVKHVILSALVATLPACMGTYRVSPEKYVPAAHPSQIVVADQSGAVILLDGPQVVNGNLVGIESGTPDTVSIPVDKVEDALVRHGSKARTIGLVSGLTIGTAAAVAFIASQGHASPCVTGKNKTDQGGGAAGGNSQCDQTLPDGVN